MAEYVQKRRAGVRVALAGREPMEGVLMLAAQAPLHPGPETILERLNTPDRVVPFQRRHDGATALLNRSEIEWVLAGQGVSPELVFPPTYLVTREERVVVAFRSGAEVQGLIRMELPPHLNRASDFLNGAEDWFPLVTDDGVVLINKLQVVETRLFESSPLPIGSDGEDDAI